MRLFDIQGRLVDKPVSKYLIDWDKKVASNLQFTVKQFLKPYWKYFIVYEEFPCYGSRKRVDIFNASLNIAVEIHGEQHGVFTPHFHKNHPSNFLKSIKSDVEKEKWLEKNDIRLIEIYHDQVDSLSKDFFKNNFNLNL